jgi:Cu/Ag efflux protein CusF
MKKTLMALVGLMLVMFMTGMPLAQEKANPGKSPEAIKPEGAKPGELKKEAPVGPVEYRMGGIITAIDAPAKKITIKQQQIKRERTLTLMLSKDTSKALPDLKIGQSVNVWINGKLITALEKVS